MTCRHALLAAAALALSAGSAAANFDDVDPTFGSGGFANTDLPYGGAIPIALASDSQQRTYVLTQTTTTSPAYVVTRYSSIGQVDTSFGSSGYVAIAPYTALTNGSQVSLGGLTFDESNNTLILVGYAPEPGGEVNFAVARYDLNGDRVTSFGSLGNGYTVFSMPTQSAGYHVLFQPDGKIVAGGVILGPTDPSGVVYDAMVVRLSSTGTPDSGFGSSGVRVIDFGTTCDSIGSLAIDAADRIVLGGQTGTANCNTPEGPVVARLTSAGALDTAFSEDGVQRFTLSANAGVRALLGQSGGKIVTTSFDATTGALTISRFTEAGALDTAFASSGHAAGDIAATTASVSQKYRLVRQTDGKLVGMGVVAGGPEHHLGVYRLQGCAELTAAGGSCAFDTPQVTPGAGGGGGGGGGFGPAALALLIMLAGAQSRRRPKTRT